MPEPITTITAGAIGAYLAKDGIQKLLGPTAEYLGGGLENLIQRRFESIKKIFESAEQKLGSSIDDAGTVPPKVLKVVLDDASFSEETLTLEYFGGVLASSRSGISRDDRGARIAKLLAGLSSYQIRAHYLMYTAVLSSHAGKQININLRAELSELKIHIPWDGFCIAMEFNKFELGNLSDLMGHIFFGLLKEGLIGDRVSWGASDSIPEDWVKSDGILFNPSRLGLELFVWGCGRGSTNSSVFNDNPLLEQLDSEILKQLGNVSLPSI